MPLGVSFKLPPFLLAGHVLRFRPHHLHQLRRSLDDRPLAIEQNPALDLIQTPCQKVQRQRTIRVFLNFLGRMPAPFPNIGRSGRIKPDHDQGWNPAHLVLKDRLKVTLRVKGWVNFKRFIQNLERSRRKLISL